MNGILKSAPSGGKKFKIGLLIVMEDRSSNFKYMQDKVADCRLPSNIVLDLKNNTDIGGVTQASKIVEKTIEFVKAKNDGLKSRKDGIDDEIDYIPFTEIYCVIDLDSNHLYPKNGKTHIEQAYDIINTPRTDNLKLNLIVSNENFEVWYILHFQDITAPLYRKNSADKDKIKDDKSNSIEFLQNYHIGFCNKHFRHYFIKIIQQNGSEVEAINRAKVLAQKSTHKQPCDNPSSDLYVLIERLNSFKL